MEADAPLEEQVAEFERSGFICLLNALPRETVAELVDAVEESRATEPECWDLRGPGSGNGWRELDEKDAGSAGQTVSASADRAEEIAVAEAGRNQTKEATLLKFSSAFDAALLCRPMVRLVNRLMGGQMICTGLNAMWRAPVPEPVPDGEPAHHQVPTPPHPRPARPPRRSPHDPRWLAQMWHREAGGTFCEDDRDRVPSAMPSCQCLFYLTDCTPQTHCFSVGTNNHALFPALCDRKPRC